MPEIEMLRVFEWSTEPTTYTVSDASGYDVVSETEASEFGVTELAEIGAEHGVTRWSEATDAERKAFDGISVIADHLLLIGWAEAPITRDDVERSYHQGHRDSRPPMVNVKVYKTELPVGAQFDELLGEFESDLDPKLAQLERSELRTLIEEYIEKHEHPFQFACEANYEQAKEDAGEYYFPGHDIRVYAEGRSGGWLVVEGLPDVDTWDPALLTKWHEFVKFCETLVDDIPRAMAWQVLANHSNELAGRIVTFTVTVTLSDGDVEDFGSPTDWDWYDMLDLGLDSTVDVRVHES